MKIAVFGATGNIGRQIVKEALSRGHQVTAVARHPASPDASPAGLQVVSGDVSNPEDVARTVAGHDAVISAVGASREGDDPRMLVAAAKSLLGGLKHAGVKRLLVVGGAGSLEVAPGVLALDTPEFPDAWRPSARVARDSLAVFRQNADLEWTYFSPAWLIAPGERTGHYRTGGDRMLTDAEGKSFISIEDYAVAMIDELEHPKHVRQRFTAAY